MAKCSIYFLPQSLYFSQFPKHPKSKQAKQKVEDFVIPPSVMIHVIINIFEFELPFPSYDNFTKESITSRLRII